MNLINISGEVLRFGIKGTMYPKLWIHVGLISPKESGLNDNKVFVNFDLDANVQSPAGRSAEFVKNKLQNNNQIFISEVMVAPIQKSSKDADGNWVNEDITGVKGKIRNIALASQRYPLINEAIISGPVLKYHHNSATLEEKFIVADKYRNVKTNEWKTREIPIMRKGVEFSNDITTKYVFVKGSLCGMTLTGESKTYIWANQVILT